MRQYKNENSFDNSLHSIIAKLESDRKFPIAVVTSKCNETIKKGELKMANFKQAFTIVELVIYQGK